MGKGFNPRPVKKKTARPQPDTSPPHVKAGERKPDKPPTQPEPLPEDIMPDKNKVSSSPTTPALSTRTPSALPHPPPAGTWIFPSGYTVTPGPPRQFRHPQYTPPFIPLIPRTTTENPADQTDQRPPFLPPLIFPAGYPELGRPFRYIPEHTTFDARLAGAAEAAQIKIPQSREEEKEILRMYLARQIEAGSELIKEGSEMVAEGHIRKKRGYRMKADAEVVMKCLRLTKGEE